MSHTLADTLYPTLISLPGVTIDQYGNLNLATEKEGYGLRPRFDYLMALDPIHLQSRILAELLEWTRWGAETFVMWECTLKEIVDLIEKWEGANPEAQKEKYSNRINWNRLSLTDWDIFLRERAGKHYHWRRRKCPKCLKYIEDYFDCKDCFTRWYDCQEVYGNIRGEDEYYLVLSADGHYLAARAWASRGKDLRTVEQHIPIVRVGL